MAFFRLEPSLEDRLDRGIALLAMKLHNAHFKPPMKLTDFLPAYDADPNENEIVKALRQTLGDRVKR